MKNITVAVTIFALLVFSEKAFAGGAAAGAQQKKQMQQQMIQQQMMQQQQMIMQQQQGQEESSEEAVEEVDISQIWEKLKTSSEAWTLIIDRQAKYYTVVKFIDDYRRKGVKIRKPPQQYVQIIDEMASQSPQLLANPFERVLMIVAVIEYDFDNGQDPDKMAMQILGKDGFAANKQRFSQ